MSTVDRKEQTVQKVRLSWDETPWHCHSFFLSVYPIVTAMLSSEYTLTFLARSITHF